MIIIKVTGLKDAHYMKVVKQGQLQTLGTIDLNSVNNWSTIKKDNNQFNINFEYISNSHPKHLSFPFELFNTSDLTNFEFSLISRYKNKLLHFPGKYNTPRITLKVEIYRK